MMKSSIELISGPYRAGKTTSLLADLAAYAGMSPLRQKPVIIVVPSSRYKKLLESRLSQISHAAGKVPGLFGIKIMPFYDLCHFALRKAGVPFKLVPEGLRPVFLTKAMVRLVGEGKLNSLAGIYHMAGTHRGILELIDELERAGLSPRDALATLSAQAATESRHVEIARVYEAYWQELEAADLYDERKLAYKAREYFAGKGANILGLGILAVDGFDRFNRLQIQVLESLSGQCEHMSICFDYAPLPEYQWKQKSVNDLHAVFGNRLMERSIERSTEIKPPTIGFKTLDRFSEMDEVVRRVKRDRLDDLAADEIKVVVRSLQPYRAAVKAAFEKAKVPYFIDEAIELNTMPLIKFVRRLVSLPQSQCDFKRKDVLLVLNSPFFNADFDSQTLVELDRTSLKFNCVQGAADWHKLPLKGNSNPALGLIQSFAACKQAGSVTDFVHEIENLLARYLRLPSDQEYSDPAINWEEHEALRAFKTVLSNLVIEETLMTRHYGPSRLSYDQFLYNLSLALDNTNFRRKNIYQDAITVCSADLVDNRPFKKIYIAGLIEGEFPKRGERSGFLSRDEVRQWCQYGIDIENPRQHESFELSLFSSLIERAREQLILSRPDFEHGGEELMPSFFVDAIPAIRQTRFGHLFAASEAARLPLSTQDLGAAYLWLKAEPQSASDLLESFRSRYGGAISLVRSRTESGALNQYNGNLREMVALGLLAIRQKSSFSVSRLNDYGKCPFRYWVSHELGYQLVKEPEQGLDSRLKGNVNHKILELFYYDLRKASLHLPDLQESEIFERLDRAVEAGFDWLSREPAFSPSKFFVFEKNEIVFRLRGFILAEKNRLNGDFVPTYFESPFGMEADSDSHELCLPAVISRASHGEFRLRGKIDRLDLSSDGTRARLIDYKTGSASIKPQDAIDGRNMQLAVYALAVRGGMPGVAPIKGQYLSISSGGISGRVDFDEDDQLLPAVEQKIVSIVDGIAAGDFSLNPFKDEDCTNCDHRSICRITEFARQPQGED